MLAMSVSVWVMVSSHLVVVRGAVESEPVCGPCFPCFSDYRPRYVPPGCFKSTEKLKFPTSFPVLNNREKSSCISEAQPLSRRPNNFLSGTSIHLLARAFLSTNPLLDIVKTNFTFLPRLTLRGNRLPDIPP